MAKRGSKTDSSLSANYSFDAFASLVAAGTASRCLAIALVLLGLLTELTGVEIHHSPQSDFEGITDVPSSGFTNYSLPLLSLEWSTRHDTRPGVPIDKLTSTRLSDNVYHSSHKSRTFNFHEKTRHKSDTNNIDFSEIHSKEDVKSSSDLKSESLNRFSNRRRTRAHSYDPAAPQATPPSRKVDSRTKAPEKQAPFLRHQQETDGYRAMFQQPNNHNNNYYYAENTKSNEIHSFSSTNNDDNFFSRDVIEAAAAAPTKDSSELLHQSSRLQVDNTQSSNHGRQPQKQKQQQQQQHSSSSITKHKNDSTKRQFSFPPIRHIWAILHRRPIPSLAATSSNRRRRNRSAAQLSSHDPQVKRRQHHQCLVKKDPRLKTPEMMKITGGAKWAKVVCSIQDRQQRVEALLEVLEEPCPHHKVCQVLSSSSLSSIKNNETCVKWVEKWLREIHHLYVDIKDFGAIFQKKFDLEKYTVVFDRRVIDDKCKVSTEISCLCR